MIVKKCYCDICGAEIDTDKETEYYLITIARRPLKLRITYKDYVDKNEHIWMVCTDCCSKIEKLIYETRSQNWEADSDEAVCGEK